MAVELKVPAVGESITEVQLGDWLTGEGESVEKDQPVVEIESDKATVELPAPNAGKVSKILKRKGETAKVGEVIGYLEESAARPGEKVKAPAEEKGAAPAGKQEGKTTVEQPTEKPKEKEAEQKPAKEKGATPPGKKAERKTVEKPAEKPKEKAEKPKEKEVEQKPAEEVAQKAAAEMTAAAAENQVTAMAKSGGVPEKEPQAEPHQDDREKEQPWVVPAARRALAEHGLTAQQVEATGRGGRLLKEDVDRYLARAKEAAPSKPAPVAGLQTSIVVSPSGGEEEIVPMSPLRRRVAERLVEAQQTAALLTTFNEVDMSAVMALRQKYRDTFQEKHGVKLGIMSFFVKAAIEALKQFPQVNAEVRGTDIVYHNYYDIGIAVGGGKGLVVPVVRGADRLSFAELEKTIADFGQRARDNKIKIEELRGGTFTISNGGVYGSLMSTPIVNPPQSGILGLHAMQDRPVARDGQVVIRPMMYLALTYDHRLVDGREAVLFLRHIKELIEEPSRILLEI